MGHSRRSEGLKFNRLTGWFKGTKLDGSKRLKVDVCVSGRCRNPKVDGLKDDFYKSKDGPRKALANFASCKDSEDLKSKEFR